MTKKYLKEFKHLFNIGFPIFGSQLSYALMGTTDTIIAGRASASDLAGLAVGNAFSMTIFMFFSGVIFAVTPIVAQLYGAKKFHLIGEKLREVLWIAVFLGFLIALLYMNMGIILDKLPIDKSVTDISEKYLKAVALGFAFITIFTCLRCYSEGMTLTKPVFYIAVFGMILNIPLDLIFVYGWFGAPKLGGVGCGIATTIVSFIMMIAIGIKYMKLLIFTPPSYETTKEVFKLGLPIGFGIFIELSMHPTGLSRYFSNHASITNNILLADIILTPGVIKQNLPIFISPLCSPISQDVNCIWASLDPIKVG